MVHCAVYVKRDESQTLPHVWHVDLLRLPSDLKAVLNQRLLDRMRTLGTLRNGPKLLRPSPIVSVHGHSLHLSPYLATPLMNRTMNHRTVSQSSKMEIDCSLILLTS